MLCFDCGLVCLQTRPLFRLGCLPALLYGVLDEDKLVIVEFYFILSLYQFMNGFTLSNKINLLPGGLFF